MNIDGTVSFWIYIVRIEARSEAKIVVHYGYHTLLL